jgi:hypothetical protein
MAEAAGLGQVGGQARSAARFACLSPAASATPHPATLRVADLPLKGGGKRIAKAASLIEASARGWRAVVD